MELDYKIILWIITILIVIYSYYDYIKDMFLWKTKPHILTWMVFVILDVITVLVQYNAWAWIGAWATMAITMLSIMIVILSFKYWEKEIKKSDIISFSLAILIVILYITLSDPTYSKIGVLVILTLGFYPTVRKTYYKPDEETLSMYYLAWIRSIIAIFATAQLSFLTLAFPIYVIFVNFLFAWMIIARKKQLWIK